MQILVVHFPDIIQNQLLHSEHPDVFSAPVILQIIAVKIAPLVQRRTQLHFFIIHVLHFPVAERIHSNDKHQRNKQRSPAPSGHPVNP